MSLIDDDRGLDYVVDLRYFKEGIKIKGKGVVNFQEKETFVEVLVRYIVFT